ncbi:MAG: hypothetical protein KAW12_18360 [Candidatus Aminicenantes bacterium]|nr:hypothetical protein [Candidatus Aminicenantes bacterium]
MHLRTHYTSRGRPSKRNIATPPGPFFEKETGVLSTDGEYIKTPFFIGAGKWELRSLSDKKIEEIVEEAEKEGEDDIDQGEFILCRNCKNVITSTSNKIEINGKFHHTFTNPQGFIYRIGCFGAAHAILNQGTSTSEFTWFSGFSWCYTLCLKCFAHLGWFYRSGEKNFYGLILDHIIEEPRGAGNL